MYQELQSVWDELTGEGGAYEVKESEVLGRNVKVFAAAPPSLREVWMSTAAYGERDYLVYNDERWSYQLAHAQVASIASWLASKGIQSGDRVAIAMRNYPEWMLVYWACVSCGITVVGMNAWWVTDEMEFALNDSTPKVLIADEERLERFLPLQDKFSELLVVAVRANISSSDRIIPFADLVASEGSLPEAQVDPDSDACIFYTSGTTGKPKGAQLTQRGCVTNIFNLAFWATALKTVAIKINGVNESEAAASSPPASLVVTPLFHVTANNCVAQMATVAGGKLVHMYRWDAGDALEIIEREKITNLSGVPVMSRELLAHPKFDEYDTSSLQSLGGGGAALQPDLVKKIDAKVKNGQPGTGYGMTETSGIITANAGAFFIDRPDSCGRAMPTFEAKCVDSKGQEVPLGEAGELWVKGAAVIRGYLSRAEATAESITDGWLHTGDVAKMDEHGFIYLVDRVKDMVLRGGENVYCAEVEAATFELDEVAECCVFGVPDDRLGEEVGLVVVVKGAGSGVAPSDLLSAERIREFLGEKLAAFKVPRYIWLRSELLPRNANGKFLKKDLRTSLVVGDAF